jgi:hypothetical protein
MQCARLFALLTVLAAFCRCSTAAEPMQSGSRTETSTLRAKASLIVQGKVILLRGVSRDGKQDPAGPRFVLALSVTEVVEGKGPAEKEILYLHGWRKGPRKQPYLPTVGEEVLVSLRGQGDDYKLLVIAAAPDAVDVKHAANRDGWSVAQTTNFRIYHDDSPRLAEKAARIAEKTRRAMSRRWFGKEEGPWSSRCDVYLHPTTRSYTGNTGAPAASPGHTTITLDGRRLLTRRVDVRLNESHALTCVLPHEVTHAILAGRFGGHVTPRWADEGIAVLSEPDERIRLHLSTLPNHLRDDNLFEVGELMRLDNYPRPRRLGAFYAQSVSLVDFLAKKKGAATFTQFVRDGLDGDYESAAKRHYGYRNLQELDRAWRRHAFGEGAVAAAQGK